MRTQSFHRLLTHTAHQPFDREHLNFMKFQSNSQLDDFGDMLAALSELGLVMTVEELLEQVAQYKLKMEAAIRTFGQINWLPASSRSLACLDEASVSNIGPTLRDGPNSMLGTVNSLLHATSTDLSRKTRHSSATPTSRLPYKSR